MKEDNQYIFPLPGQPRPFLSSIGCKMSLIRVLKQLRSYVQLQEEGDRQLETCSHAQSLHAENAPVHLELPGGGQGVLSGGDCDAALHYHDAAAGLPRDVDGHTGAAAIFDHGVHAHPAHPARQTFNYHISLG